MGEKDELLLYNEYQDGLTDKQLERQEQKYDELKNKALDSLGSLLVELGRTVCCISECELSHDFLRQVKKLSDRASQKLQDVWGS